MLNRYFHRLTISISVALISVGCATQTPAPEVAEQPFSEQQQRQAQLAQQPKPLALKHKIALGRISNETIHGRSLLRGGQDSLSKQVTDMLSQQLTESGSYIVFERPDIEMLQNEAELTGESFNAVGVDTLLIGSLTEFGRRTEGERGFLSSTQTQIAHARVDLRLVDTRTGQVVYSVSGTGEASSEAGNVAGFGSRAGYDSALNDIAVANALNAAVQTITRNYRNKPWQADILAKEGEQLYISGGASQGVTTDMEFDVQRRGEYVQSRETGFRVQLPGTTVARIRIDELFGQASNNEGAIASLISGSLEGHQLADLVVVKTATTE